MIDETFDYPEYLAAKKAIDDISLNTGVWSALATWLQTRQRNGGRLRILEIGAGIGTMFERLHEHDLLQNADYTALELEPDFENVARLRLASVLSSRPDINLNWHCGDALSAGKYFPGASFDLLIGHAVIDLLPVPICMPSLLDLIARDGTCYFSLNYAGLTRFAPVHPADEDLMTAYNADMDKRFPGLDWLPSQTGTLLEDWMHKQGYTIIAAGNSDWHLASQGNPLAHSDRFIGNILDTIAKALDGRPGLADWLHVRRAQLQKGQLEFRAANRDLFSSIV